MKADYLTLFHKHVTEHLLEPSDTRAQAHRAKIKLFLHRISEDSFQFADLFENAHITLNDQYGMNICWVTVALGNGFGGLWIYDTPKGKGENYLINGTRQSASLSKKSLRCPNFNGSIDRLGFLLWVASRYEEIDAAIEDYVTTTLHTLGTPVAEGMFGPSEDDPDTELPESLISSQQEE